MTIKTKLYLISIVYILFLGVLAIAQVYTARGVTVSIEKAEIAGRIAHKLSVLNMLTQDYLLQKTERAKTQWQTTYNAVENLIEHNFDPHENIGHDHTRQEELILQELYADHQFIGEQFARIIQPGISQDALGKLAFQAVVRSQDMVSKAFGLSDAATRAVLHAQQINSLLNLILLPAMLLLVLFGFLFLVFPALKSLKKISKGAEFIGKGNFSHRIDIPSRDEVGDLAIAFNGMSDNLEKITASRDALNKEIAERKLAQAALKESERRLGIFMSNLPGMAYRCRNTQGWPLKFVSEGALALTGYTPGELTASGGWMYEKLILPEDRAYVSRTVAEALDTNRLFQMEYRIWGKGGVLKHVWEQGVFVSANENEAPHLEGFIIDISERKRLEYIEQKRMLRVKTLLSISEHADQPVSDIVATALDSLVALTESKLGFLGFINESETIMSAQFWSEQVMQSCAMDNKPVVFELENGGLWTAAVKEQRPVIINDYTEFHPLKKGSPEGHIALTRFLSVPLIRNNRTMLLAGLANKDGPYTNEDQLEAIQFLEGFWSILQRKQVEETLKSSEERLQEANRELLRSNQELEQFAYVASHDLQEPLRMVSSYTQLLAKRYGDKLDQDALDFINYAVDGANRMQRLIQDLLIYSRITTRGDDFSSVDVHEVVGNALKNLQTLIQEKGGLVSVDELPVIMGDYRQVMQLFQNLIGNAVKFCRPEQPPRVHINATMNTDRYGLWTFSVTDNGIGIDEKYFDRIFVIFQRLHGRQVYSGTGIGLALCKRIVERHGGEIWLTSSVEEGTVFYFTLPAFNEKKERQDEHEADC